jgi:hypothetical protein
MAPLKNILFGSGLLLCMTGLVHAASPAQQVTAAAAIAGDQRDQYAASGDHRLPTRRHRAGCFRG